MPCSPAVLVALAVFLVADAVRPEEGQNVNVLRAIETKDASTQDCSYSHCTLIGQGEHGTAYDCPGDYILKTPIGKKGTFVAELADESNAMKTLNDAKMTCIPTRLEGFDGTENGCLKMTKLGDNLKPPWGTYSTGWKYENNNGNQINDQEITNTIQNMLNTAAANGKGHDKASGNFLMPNVGGEEALKGMGCPLYIIDMPENTYNDDDTLKNPKASWADNCKSLKKNLFPKLNC